MASLVANYGSDSDNSEGSEEEEKQESGEGQIKNKDMDKLLPAEILLEQDMRSKPSSVFTNPYKEAEKNHAVLLERHVKMTDVKQQTTVKKHKICWKFKKGKCFDTNCPFVHDCATKSQTTTSADLTEEDSERVKDVPQKKRCGVTDTLIPPKKFMKSYIKNTSHS